MTDFKENHVEIIKGGQLDSEWIYDTGIPRLVRFQLVRYSI